MGLERVHRRGGATSRATDDVPPLSFASTTLDSLTIPTPPSMTRLQADMLHASEQITTGSPDLRPDRGLCRGGHGMALFWLGVLVSSLFARTRPPNLTSHKFLPKCRTSD